METIEVENTKKIIIGVMLKNIAPDFLPTDEHLSLISSKIQSITIEKGDFFAKPGEVCDYIGILLDQKGILKAYSHDEKGDKKVSRIFYSPHNMVVSSFESFKNNKPADEYIEAVNKVLILGIKNIDLEEIYNKIPAFNIVGRLLAEQSYISAIERLKEMQRLNGRELVASFYREKKILIGQLDKSEIASYLGLSRNKYSDYLTEIMKSESKSK